MPGLFQGIEVGKQALLSHQASLQTIGHNIANVNTRGYTRQRVDLSTAHPEQSMYGSIGSGVRVTDIRQIRDLFLGEQYRSAQKNLGQWSYMNKSMTQIESVFSEPMDGSLNESLDNFWNDWTALSSDADNSGNRNSLISSAKELIVNFGKLSDSLADLRQSTDRDLAAMTAEVNEKTAEISGLNQQIVVSELGGSSANDLRDTRDVLIDDLASLIDVNTHEDANGATKVYMGSMLLVDGPDSFKLGVKVEREGEKVTHSMVWAGSEHKLKNTGGLMAGLVQTRDEVIPRYLEDLNRMARTIVEQVNKAHMSGFGLDGSTGIAFFDPASIEAGNLRINSEILQDTDKIAASDSSNPDDRGNGSIAALIADLRSELIMSGGSTTINQYYTSLVSNLGVEARQASSFAENYELVSRQVDNQLQSVQGVSLDEEMANMIQSQKSFESAARVITMMDEALDTIISRMGIVG